LGFEEVMEDDSRDAAYYYISHFPDQQCQMRVYRHEIHPRLYFMSGGGAAASNFKIKIFDGHTLSFRHLFHSSTLLSSTVRDRSQAFQSHFDVFLLRKEPTGNK
jgi:hypothetical protein